MTGVDPASLPLRDVHLPPSPEGWLSAMGGGWAIAFAALILIALVALGLYLWRVRLREKAAGLMFDATVDAAADNAARVAAISELLRRAARRRDPAADRLSGEAWLHFLDAGRRGDARLADAGRTLLEGGFRRDVDAGALAALQPRARACFVAMMRRAPRRRWMHGRMPWRRG